MSHIGQGGVGSLYLWDGSKLVTQNVFVDSITGVPEVVEVSPATGASVVTTPYMSFNSAANRWSVGRDIIETDFPNDSVLMGANIKTTAAVNAADVVCIGTRIQDIQGTGGVVAGGYVLIGTDVARGSILELRSVIIGAKSGVQATRNSSGSQSVVLGVECAQNMQSNAGNTVCVGYRAGASTSSSSPGNVYVGSRAGEDNANGNTNTFLGASSGLGVVNTDNGVFVGTGLTAPAGISASGRYGAIANGREESPGVFAGLITFYGSGGANNDCVAIQAPSRATVLTQVSTDNVLSVYGYGDSPNGVLELNSAPGIDDVPDGARVRLFTGSFDPNTLSYNGAPGPLAGSAGDVFMRAAGTVSTVYVCDGAGTWNSLRGPVTPGSVTSTTVTTTSPAPNPVVNPGPNSLTRYVMTNTAARSLELPPSADDGARIEVKEGAGTTTGITVTVNGGGTIDFGASFVISTAGGSATFQWDATSSQWWTI